MTLDEVAENKPEPPKLGMYIAVLLELFMLGVFAYNQSIAGALSWVAYYRFSATSSLMWRIFRGEE